MHIDTDAHGNVFIVTEVDGHPHRRPINPGRWEHGVWIDTDISTESAEVQSACHTAWTLETVAAYMAMSAGIDSGSNSPVTISKDAIWRRATDAEAEQMEAALQAQPVRLRRIYEGATFISTEDELFGVLEAALVQLFGAERAAQLLEPTA